MPDISPLMPMHEDLLLVFVNLRYFWYFVTGDTAVTVAITNTWSEGFSGKINAHIKNDIRGGWTMMLVFPVPVTSIEVSWMAHVKLAVIAETSVLEPYRLLKSLQEEPEDLYSHSGLTGIS